MRLSGIGLQSIMVEQRAELEERYNHLPAEIAPMTYPIDPYTTWKGVGAPLHPGAKPITESTAI